MEYNFDVEKNVERIKEFIKDYFVNNATPDTKAVIGISGGKDSTVAAKLLVDALGKHRVIGVMMPQDVQRDIDDSRKVCELLDIAACEIDIGPACAALYRSIDEGYDYDHTTVTNIPAITTNTPSRIRMTTLYAVAATIGGRVCNTGNASEAFVGYTTKYGDLAGDFALLKNFTVSEIFEIGDYLGLPYDLVHKTPSDGMSGKSDEENTGVPYRVIDDYLMYGIYPAQFYYEKMMAAYKRNIHKQVINLPAPRRCGSSLNRPGEELWF